MPSGPSVVDRIVIGAGIAGASVAAELARTGSVVLLETETQAGYHTTGRSAAQFTKAYGPPVIRALTRASESFFRAPESEHIAKPLLRPRGVMFVARPDQEAALDHLAAALGDAVVRISAQQACAMSPLLRPDYVSHAVFDEYAADIDVDALHQHYLKSLRALGADIRMKSPVRGLQHTGGLWQVETATGTLRAPVVVNAAGAWADEVAGLAGIAPAGLTPKRRTALLVAPPEGAVIDDWPMVVDVDERFYLKPDAGKLLISPADETVSPPCDAQPDELDVAICIDRIETAFDLSIRRIDHKWAGLRNFLPSGSPIACFDRDAPGFFWLAGQGGYGIQSAPALARTAAALIDGTSIPLDIAGQGVNQASLMLQRKEAAA